MSRDLYNHLRNVSPRLADELDQIYREALKIWEEQFLPKFTAHGKLHIEQVERNLDALTRPLQESGARLSAEEIFVLLAACCLHDIGMQLADDPDARAKHAEYAHQLILYSSAQIGPEQRRVTLAIVDSNARRTIAQIARGHWTDFALQLREKEFIYENQEGRLRLLGVLLASADLLDISPVRARYFRSIHRLYDLEPLSELHQTMHHLVKGFRIEAPNPQIRGDLQFQLEWRNNDEIVNDMSEWVLRWFTSQWRQLAPALHTESGGAIRWTRPWATVQFDPPAGPMPELSPAALKILGAERAEQIRIDRDKLIEQFQEILRSRGTGLFLFPHDSDLDGRMLTEWCEARARLQDECLIARIDVQPSAPLDLSSLISQVLEQWGEHLPKCSDREALIRLESFVCTNVARCLVTIIVAEIYTEELLDPILEILLRRLVGIDHGVRLCVLVTHGMPDANKLGNPPVFSFDELAISRSEVEQHLQKRLGYSKNESHDIYERLSGLEIAEKPGKVYDYFSMHCGLT